MEWMGMTSPCMLTDTKLVRIANDFTIKAVIKPDIIGGKQSIISKRVPLSKGNRPGVILLLHGRCIELMTFENNGKAWMTARTLPKVIEVGQQYEILAFRAGNEARIYVNGFDRTNPIYNKVCPGDLSCEMDAFCGMQLYDEVKEKEVFVGKIFMIGLYDDAYFNDAAGIRYPRNPHVLSVEEARTAIPKKYPELAEKIGMKRA